MPLIRVCGGPEIEELMDVSKRYWMILGTAVLLGVLAVGGIAAAEQGGQSSDHRQNPTTTSAAAAPAPEAAPQGAGNDAGVDDQGQGPSSESQHARCDIALNNGAPIAQWNKSQAPAFADCNPPLLGTARPEPGNGGGQGQGGGPDNPGSQGQDHGRGAGPADPQAQGHGKP
jgi:hypothetical protein